MCRGNLNSFNSLLIYNVIEFLIKFWQSVTIFSTGGGSNCTLGGGYDAFNRAEIFIRYQGIEGLSGIMRRINRWTLREEDHLLEWEECSRWFWVSVVFLPKKAWECFSNHLQNTTQNAASCVGILNEVVILKFSYVKLRRCIAAVIDSCY